MCYGQPLRASQNQCQAMLNSAAMQSNTTIPTCFLRTFSTYLCSFFCVGSLYVLPLGLAFRSEFRRIFEDFLVTCSKGSVAFVLEVLSVLSVGFGALAMQYAVLHGSPALCRSTLPCIAQECKAMQPHEYLLHSLFKCSLHYLLDGLVAQTQIRKIRRHP